MNSWVVGIPIGEYWGDVNLDIPMQFKLAGHFYGKLATQLASQDPTTKLAA